MDYSVMKTEEQKKEQEKCLAEYRKYQELGLSLDLSRGKPSAEQLALSMGILDSLKSTSVLHTQNGTDCRNYGGLDGIEEAKDLMRKMLGTKQTNVMVLGNSSLTIMFLLFNHAMLDGLLGETPMCMQKKRKFLCPAPGYDRHFGLTEYFGFELVTVPMKEDGPDMDVVEKLVASDETIKGIWCVPKYQNPTGVVFSEEVVKRFAALKPKAKDFRIFWDNAYCIHDLYKEEHEIPDLLDLAEKEGNGDMVYEFCSTSKVAFPGDGIAAFATSPANMIAFKNYLKQGTIGPDKINQLRQVRYFHSIGEMKKHMKKQADIMRPKFEMVERILEEELGSAKIASWTNPRGGYFISFDTMEGCAKRTIELCRDAGVKFTPAGATFPYGKDPKDSNIRIAPSFASAEEIEMATKIFAVSVKLATLEKLSANS